MFKTSPGLSLLSIPFLMAAACDSAEQPIKIDSAITTPQSATRTGDIVREVGAAVGFLTADDSMVARLQNWPDDPEVANFAARAHMPSALMQSLRDTPALRIMAPAAVPSMLTAEEQADDTGSDLESLIKDRILVDSNIETKSDTEITYLLKPDPTCMPLPSRLATGASPTLDPDCVRTLTLVQVRIVVRGDGDGARFQVELGPDRFETSAFTVHSDLLAWQADLSNVKKAADYAGNALNGRPALTDISKMEGVLRAQIRKDGEKKVTLSFSVLEAVDVEGPWWFGLNSIFTTGKSDPLFSLSADGVAKQATFGLNVAQTDLKTVWDPNFDLFDDSGKTPPVNMDQHLSMAGLYGQTVLSEGAKEIDLNGIGVGPSYMAVRGTHIVDVNLNPNDGRKLDVKVTLGSQNRPHLEVTPKFDFTLGYNYQSVAKDYNDELPEWVLDETLSILFVPDGAPAAVLEMVKNPMPYYSPLPKVVAGTLTLAAKGRSNATVTVPAGMCLVEVDNPTQEAPSVWGDYAAGNCQ